MAVAERQEEADCDLRTPQIGSVETSGNRLLAVLLAIDGVGGQVVGERVDGGRRVVRQIQVEMSHQDGTQILVRSLLRHHRAEALAEGLQAAERIWTAITIQHLPL